MKIVLALLSLATLTACCGVGNRNLSGLTTTSADVRLGGMVRLAERCPSEVSGTAPTKGLVAVGLLGVLASTGAQFAVDAIEGAITDYKNGLSGFFMASTPSNMTQLDKAGCLILARGLIGNLSRKVAARDGRLTKADLATLGLADYPAFYLEMRLRRSATSILLEPIYLSYAASSARNNGSGKKYVSVAIAFSKTALKKGDNPGAIVTSENSFAVAYLEFGQIHTARRYGVDALSGTEANAQVNEGQLKDIQDFSITAVVTESEDAGIALKALQSAFTPNKDALKGEFEKMFKKALGVKESE